MMSGKIVKPDMRGIDRNRKGANHASSRQYPVDHSWWVGHRNRMGIGGTDSVHLHHRHPVRPSSVQDGGTHPDAVWQNRAIRRRSRLCLGQHPVGGAGRLVDGVRLSGSRRTQLHLHHRYSVRIAIVQDGQACAGHSERKSSTCRFQILQSRQSTLDEAVTDVNNWIDQQAAKAE